MLQMFFVGFLLILVGILTCLAVATDPNVEPNPRRQSLLSVGLAMLFAGVGTLGSILGFDYLADALEWPIPAGLAFLGVGLSVVGGAVLGFSMGCRRNRKLNY